jgi:hypothetical protein
MLAALFLFAGSMKFIMPVEAMTQQMPVHLPVWFIHFIGIAEMTGAVGLILPALLRIQPQLTPLAAAGLLIIMVGATVISALGAIAGAALPFVVGLLCSFVSYGRARVAPIAHTPVRPLAQLRVSQSALLR